jgi:hypothetical protein
MDNRMNFYYARFLMLLAVIGCASTAGSTTLTFLDDTGKETPLVSGVNKLPSLRGTVRADSVPSNTQSVLFKVNGNRRVENAPPYYSEGDIQGKPNISVWEPKAYTISAACYTRDGANGAVITSGGVSLKVTLQLGTPDPTPDPDPDPDPTPDPEPPPTPTGSVFGNFALQPGSDDVQPAGSGRRISEAQLRLKGVDGLTIRARPHWDYLPFYESCLNTCSRTGDKATLLMMGGITQTPWDAANIARYEQIANSMGARFANHPLVVGVHVCGCSPPSVSEELHWKPSDNRAYIAANKKLIDIWAKAFPKQVLLLAIGGGDPAGMREIITYGQSKYGSRLLIKHNSAKASTTLTAAHNVLVAEAGKKGSHIGFEMVGSTGESRFGGTLQQAFDKMDAVCTQAGKPRRQYYRAIYPPDLSKLGSIR